MNWFSRIVGSSTPALEHSAKAALSADLAMSRPSVDLIKQFDTYEAKLATIDANVIPAGAAEALTKFSISVAAASNDLESAARAVDLALVKPKSQGGGRRHRKGSRKVHRKSHRKHRSTKSRK